MLKHWAAWLRNRWAAWPRGIQWLVGGIVAVVLALAVTWVLFVSAADWLAHHDVGSAQGSLLQTARDAARGRLLTLGAGLFAAAALVFTARNFTLSRRTFELAEQGQVTERYTKAIEQLGSKELDVRIGGIYALERVARESAIDHPIVVEVLTAFVRVRSHVQWPPPDPGSQDQARSTRPDVQAAVTVIGRRDAKRDMQRIDLGLAFLVGAQLGRAVLTGANLRGADLASADLTDADLRGTHLTGADLTSANLRGTILAGADLTGADLRAANLTSANLRGTILARADIGTVLAGANIGTILAGAHLGTAVLTGVDLRGANLTGANLRDANLRDANLRDAFLVLADLTGADLTGADLGGADLTRARWPEGTRVPAGWKLDTSSGRLEVAGIDSGPADAN
jgi:uncharacterized protein YjbI with pentapeptide repeats